MEKELIEAVGFQGEDKYQEEEVQSNQKEILEKKLRNLNSLAYIYIKAEVKSGNKV